MEKKQVLSIKVTLGTYPDFIAALIDKASNAQSSYTCVANVHMLVEAHNDPGFAKVVNEADITTPDGQPLTWAIKLLHGISQPRVAGMDILPDMLAEATQKQIPVFFYGGTEEMQLKTSSYLQASFPTIKIAGMYSPPFRPLTSEEETGIVTLINQSGAGLIFVVLGCPKQEKWMAAMRGRINGCMVGIGGALPVLIGMQKRAPRWMQKAGLEWFYRLCQEPKRLFKRYAITNTKFIYLLLKAKLSFRKKQG
jgi:N-acetylglucosaminyldiphosphoundecaprenol N-acetyl-beta-D-mannosaminyltransferase